jgi:hypothetical protein
MPVPPPVTTTFRPVLAFSDITLRPSKRDSTLRDAAHRPSLGVGIGPEMTIEMQITLAGT